MIFAVGKPHDDSEATDPSSSQSGIYLDDSYGQIIREFWHDVRTCSYHSGIYLCGSYGQMMLRTLFYFVIIRIMQ